MTWPTPMTHWNGWPRSRDESNLVPSVRVPTSSVSAASSALTVDGDLVTGLGEGLAVAAAETLASAMSGRRAEKRGTHLNLNTHDARSRVEGTERVGEGSAKSAEGEHMDRLINTNWSSLVRALPPSCTTTLNLVRAASIHQSAKELAQDPQTWPPPAFTTHDVVAPSNLPSFSLSRTQPATRDSCASASNPAVSDPRTPSPSMPSKHAWGVRAPKR
jgi:hypothetical protein